MNFKNKKYVWFGLISIILIGSFLRLYKLGFQCIWTEEEYTRNIAHMSFSQIWQIIITTDYTSPLFYWIEHIIGLIAGYDNTDLRILSAICGILLIPATFWLGKTYKDESTGLISAGLVSILFPFIYYSQFARAYSLSVLAFTLFLIFYIKILKGDSSKTNIIVVGLLASLNLWVHLYSIIPISLFILILLWNIDWKSKKILITSIIIPSLPLLQIIYTLLTNRVGLTNLFPFGLKYYELIAATPTEFYNNAFPFIMILVILGLFLKRDDIITWMLFIVSVLSIISGILFSFFTPIFPRYYLTVSLITIIIASIPLAEVLNYVKKDWATISIIMIILLLLILDQNASIIGHYLLQRYIC